LVAFTHRQRAVGPKAAYWAAFAFLRAIFMRTFVYIDGFNFYYLRLKQQRVFRWLNLKLLSEQIVGPAHKVDRVNFYTARVSGKIDPDGPRKQHIYLSALGTVPEICVHFGHFLFAERFSRLTLPPRTKPADYNWNLPLPDRISIPKVEEKGSDVNLASHLVRDACRGSFEQALVISNDTDLVEPIRIVVEELKIPVGIVAPNRARKGDAPMPSPSLKAAAAFTLYIDDAHLETSQFPETIETPKGKLIRRPTTWR